MCTAISLTAGRHYFGRTLDLERHYGEEVVICPRRFPLPLRHLPPAQRHHAMIGMAHVEDGYPLYYDAANEHGLCMAALNFPEFCAYHAVMPGRDNVAPFELIPFVLGQCRSLGEARACLERVNLCHTPFSPDLPLTPLHFMLADSDGCLVVESTAGGLKLYDNPAFVMTNSPPFDMQLLRLGDYMNVTREPAVSRFSPDLPLTAYSGGMGGIGLPGDLSSGSRFVRAAFARFASENEDGQDVEQFFHLLDFVSVPRGLVKLREGAFQKTVYACCIDAQEGVYYYKTYENSRLSAVGMRLENLDGERLYAHALRPAEAIVPQNAKAKR